VLVITRADLEPPDHGAAVRIDRTAWGVSRLGLPVYIVTDARRCYHRYVDGNRESVRFPFWLTVFGPSRRSLARRIRRLGVPADEAFLYGALIDWNLWLRAAYVAAKHGLRIFQAEFPAYAEACVWVSSVLGGHTLLVEHNVEYERLAGRLPPLRRDARAFVRDVEIRLCSRVDAVVTVSSRDQATLCAAGVSVDKIIVIPHGVDINAFDKAIPSAASLRRHGIPVDRPIIVYHGTYLYPPNIEAIELLVAEILPRLRAHGVAAVVIAVGPHPPATRVDPDVFFTGSVESVAPYIRTAQVAVMPLQHGGGTRMKVMDYFAARVPVVSTSKGVEGLGLVDGRELLVRDDWPGFAQAVAEVIDNPDVAGGLTDAGRRYVERLDWSEIAQQYLDLYEALGRRS
jgi:glycosyltransferase involved in cell wall biosynthesis